MRRDIESLVELSALTQADYESRKARMTRLRLREEEMRGQLARIDADRRAQLAALSPADPAVRAGAIAAWEGWVESRQRALNMDLARLRVEIEKARGELARSFGRDVALRELIGRRVRSVSRLDQRRRDGG